MKHLLSISLLTLLPAFATEEADFSTIDPGKHSNIPYIRHAGHDDDAIPPAYLQQRLEVLQGVHDNLSAKSAVAILRTLHPSKVSRDIQVDTPINVLQMNIAVELNRLRDASFYGCKALAELLNFSAEAALLPETPTTELLQRLQGEMLKNAADRPAQSDVSGGPGFSADSAWVVHVTDKSLCYDAAFAAATDGFDDWLDSALRMEILNERRFIVYTITLIRDGKKYKVDQWCDITRARKVYSEEEQKQAMQQIVENLQQMQRLMLSINDKASADATAPKMQELIKAISPLHDIAATQNTETSLMNNLTPGFDYAAFREAIKRHQEQNFYGSDALRDFIRSLVGMKQ